MNWLNHTFAVNNQSALQIHNNYLSAIWKPKFATPAPSPPSLHTAPGLSLSVSWGCLDNKCVDKGNRYTRTHSGLTFGAHDYLAGILVQIWAVYNAVHGQSRRAPAKASLSLSDGERVCLCMMWFGCVCGRSGIEFLQVQMDLFYRLGSSNSVRAQATRRGMTLKALQSAALVISEMSPSWVC